MSLSVRSRRVLARVSIAAGFGCLLARVIAPAVVRPFWWALGASTCVTAVVSIACGLDYLRTSGRPS